MRVTKFLSGTALLAVLAQPATVLAQAQGEAVVEDAEDRDNVIIVTGQKITRTLQDTPESVSITTAEDIEEQNYRDIFDVIGQTANVTSLFSGEGFSIRGLRNSGASAGDQTSDVASIYVDGVFIPSSLLANGAFSLWDTQSVEIFRGPQSTIQGRNALAGAIVIRTRDPGDDFSGNAQFEAAEFNTYRGSAALTIPIAPGQVSLRLAGDYQTTDGFQNNIFLNRDDIDEAEAYTARGTLLVTPDFAPRFSARFNFTYSDQSEGENRVAESLFPAQRVSNQDLIDQQGAEAYILSSELSYDITDEITLTSVTGYIESDSFFNFDSDSNDSSVITALGGTSELQESMSTDEIFSQELRLTYSGDGIDVLLGGYFFDSNGTFASDNTTVVGTDFAFPDAGTLAFLVFGAVNPTTIAQATAIRDTIVANIPFFPVTLQRGTDDSIRNYAIFGEASIDLTDRLTLILGARYDSEKIDQSLFDSVGAPILTIGDPLIDQILAGVTTQFSNQFTLVANNSFDAFLPKAVLSYDLSDDVTASISYQRAYRAGGLSFNTFRGALAGANSSQDDLENQGIVNSFDPEFTNNYELSFRSTWLDGDLTVNANAYYIDYTNQQVNVILSQNPLDTLTDNVGASRLYGFELETVMRPTDRFEAFFNVGFADTQFTDGGEVVGGSNITGFEFPYASRWTVGFGGRYEHPSGIYGNVRTRLTDKSFSSVNAIERVQGDPTTVFQNFTGLQDSSFVVDLAIGWENDNFGVELFARNLLNEKYLSFDPFNDPIYDAQNQLTGFIPNNATTAIAGAPQVFGIRLTGGF